MVESQYNVHMDLPMVSHVNYQPELIAGLNFTEVLMATAIAAAIGLPLGGVIAYAIGRPVFSIGIGFALAIAFGYGTTKLLKRLKRQRPDGYYVQRLMRAFDPIIPGVRFIRRPGYYDRYRHDHTPTLKARSVHNEKIRASRA